MLHRGFDTGSRPTQQGDLCHAFEVALRHVAEGGRQRGHEPRISERLSRDPLHVERTKYHGRPDPALRVRHEHPRRFGGEPSQNLANMCFEVGCAPFHQAADDEVDLRRELPGMVRSLWAHQHEPVDNSWVTSDRGKCEMTAIAPAPQRESFVTERRTNIRDVVRALAAVVRLEADAARAEVRRDAPAGAVNVRQPPVWRSRFVQRKVVACGRLEVRARPSGAPLVDADHVSVEHLPDGRTCLGAPGPRRGSLLSRQGLQPG